MTCDFCFDGRHWKCHDRKCECDICALERRRAKATPRKREAVSASRSAVGTMGHSENLRVYSTPKPRVRTGERARYYQSPLTDAEKQRRNRLGVLTRFTDEQVARIFEAKKAGGSISELARELNSTRDKVRTVYNCPAAPALGERGPALGTMRFTTMREEFDGDTWQVVYKKRWSNSDR